MEISSKLVSWLILISPGLGCDIMGYESEPLPSYTKLRNCYYSVNLITSLPRLFLRIIYRVLIPPAQHPDFPRHPIHLRSYWIEGAAGHPLCYGCLLPLDVHSNRGGSPRHPSPHLLMVTPTLRLPRVSPASPWSVAPPDDGIPSVPWTYPRSPPRSCCHIISSTASPPCTFLPGPAPLLPSFPVPSLSYPTASKLCAGLGIQPPNICCYRRSSAPGMVIPLTVTGSWPWSVTRPYFPWSSVVGYCAWGAFLPPAYILPLCTVLSGTSPIKWQTINLWLPSLFLL